MSATRPGSRSTSPTARAPASSVARRGIPTPNRNGPSFRSHGCPTPEPQPVVVVLARPRPEVPQVRHHRARPDVRGVLEEIDRDLAGPLLGLTGYARSHRHVLLAQRSQFRAARTGAGERLAGASLRLSAFGSAGCLEPGCEQEPSAPGEVREGRLELPRPEGHQDLNLARLPFRHSRVNLSCNNASLSLLHHPLLPTDLPTRGLSCLPVPPSCRPGHARQRVRRAGVCRREHVRVRV